MAEFTAELLEKVLATGRSLAHPITEIDGLYPYAVIPGGYTVQRLPERLERPERIERNLTVFDADSFTKYFTDYCNESSRIFVDGQGLSIVGVIDYHDQNGTKPEPNWLKHRVSYCFRKTEEWKTWEAKSAKGMDQVEFGRFLEDNLPDVIEPEPAHLLQVALTMEAKKKANFSSAIRLDNGETQFLLEEEIRGTAAKGTLDIPREFTLAISPFEGSVKYKLVARLRYRIHEGSLSIWYELVRRHKVIEDAVNDVVSKIRQGVTNPITFGTI